MRIAIDIGGTKTRIAILNANDFGDPKIISTPEKYDDAIAAIKSTVLATALSENSPNIESVVVGKRGTISHDGEIALHDTNFPDWANKPIAADLRTALTTSKVTVVNDTALVALGEAVYGAGKGNGIVAYLTVSTGVGGARIVNGKIDVSAQGFEIGGQYLDVSAQHTLESLISGTTIEKKFGMRPVELGKEHTVWAELATILAVGVHNTILHWSPDVVVIGGSMMNEIGIPVEKVSAHVAAIMKKFTLIPPIVHSSLGDFGGLWGALTIK